jgi:spore germination protein KA
VIAAAAAFGLYGICIAAFCILAGLCGMRSLGAPYFAPLAPPRPHNPDLLLRLPVWLHRRAAWVRKPNWMEAKA